MAADLAHLEVLAAYPDDCRASQIEPLGSAGGFSGARFWRVSAPCGVLCLRRWPPEHPSPEQLQFIQAVLWHVVQEGFRLVPLPLSTRLHKGYVRLHGHLWELTPWMPGKADYRAHPTHQKLRAAMVALAEFHLAAATFPLPHPPRSPSPGIRDRHRQLRRWLSGDLARLAEAIEPGLWPELERPAARLFRLVPGTAEQVLALLSVAARFEVSLQPCIRDIWHNHVLFEGDEVRGLIDFGSMAADNVAADVARLLGSMAQDDAHLWEVGLDAYRCVRPLSDTEDSLMRAFDRSTVLMAGLNWIDWIYRQRRVPENREAIPRRLNEILSRLERLSD